MRFTRYHETPLCSLGSLWFKLLSLPRSTARPSPSQSTTSRFGWSRSSSDWARAARLRLRNDSAQPQKVVALQISSSLNWRAIRAADKALQFVSQPYTSDIDHTGSLSEAIVYAAG